MTLRPDRRSVLAAAALLGLPSSIARAMTIDAQVRTGTLKDVEHVVILMQENRSFDHYFGAMKGVRGFGDRFPIPTPDTADRKGKTVWTQVNGKSSRGPRLISPFHLNTVQAFPQMRVTGTPHNWPDAQAAWDEGRMDRWPESKTAHAMGYYRAEDLPFQYALAEAFTVCDAYHCSMQTGTNSNRLFLWSGTNDPSGKDAGPSLSNSHENLATLGGHPQSYTWTNYVERLQAAGVSWHVYQDMADNFTDNPLAGFKAFRDSYAKAPGADPRLAEHGLSTRRLDGLREDVTTGKLPQVSYIIAPAADSEHPGPSSPAQGADYTARVLDALTADPKVWSKTVLLVMFDENDGFFDHVPPPAPPSRDAKAPGGLVGGSTVDLAGEHHLVRSPGDPGSDKSEFMGRPYGLGPRVPMYVISPWSRGGFVNSEVFDHTSVIRFLEQRFGVAEPNLSPWRRAVCGDLTSAFDFRTPNDTPFASKLPKTAETAARAAALRGHTTPLTPDTPATPEQAVGVRPSRALPYDLDVAAAVGSGSVELTFRNAGAAGAVFHVYDRARLQDVPRRYTVEAGKTLKDAWSAEGGYDLWVLGPNGFHRHFAGAGAGGLEVSAVYDPSGPALTLTVSNTGEAILSATVAAPAYGLAGWRPTVAPGASASRTWSLQKTGGWYDLALSAKDLPDFRRRLAGRVETGRNSVSDPAMGGPALMEQSV